MGYNLTQINPAYELVSDVVVGTATSSVDFTGLNITKEDDYMLVSTIITSSNNAHLLFVNGNGITSNYYRQELVANGTTISGYRSDGSYFAGSNGSSLWKTNIKLTNNGYFVYQSNGMFNLNSSVVLNSEYGTSTFTMSSITSLIISGSIVAGSRFQLYKRVAPIIADITVSTATTSVDITGLSIDKGSEYMLVASMTDASSAKFVSLYANNNTTSTNYYSQRLEANYTTITSGRSNASWLNVMNTSSTTFTIANIKLTNNGYFVWQSNGLRSIKNTGSLEIENIYGTSTFTATSITQLTLMSSATFGVGSRFQLIKLK